MQSQLRTYTYSSFIHEKSIMKVSEPEIEKYIKLLVKSTFEIYFWTPEVTVVISCAKVPSRSRVYIPGGRGLGRKNVL